MKILFLSRWLPAPADNGSKIRILNVLKQLAVQHTITLATFRDAGAPVSTESLEELKAYCAAVRVFPYREFRPRRARAVVGFLSPQPRWLVDTYSPEMAALVSDEARRGGYDLVVASQLPMVPYALAATGTPLLLEELELAAFRDASVADVRGLRRLRGQLMWFKLAAYVRRVLPRFGVCTVVSDNEYAMARSIAPGYTNLEVVPNCVDAASYLGDFGPVDPNTLVFSGALTYGPNADAVRYFVGDVLPLIRRAVPEARLRITGRCDEPDRQWLQDVPGVELTGYVPDIRPVVARSAVAVVPLRAGGGTRLKILEAMALGTPVVSTHKGAEGLRATAERDIVLVDDAREFASRVLDLLRSPSSRTRLGEQGRRLVQTQYNWATRGESIRRAVARAADESLNPGSISDGYTAAPLLRSTQADAASLGDTR
jgi:glycosyltransferase involved in cell wall biosynthesis